MWTNRWINTAGAAPATLWAKIMSKKNKRKSKQAAKNATQANPDKASGVNAAAAGNMDKKKPKKANKSKKSAKGDSSLLNRRNMLKLLIGVPVAGAAGAAIHRYDVQNRGIHDLSLIGQGQPVVVQVHDPSCQLCRRLMKNTRKALKGNDDVLFKVADVTTSEGEAFRRKHNAETVSLVLFDAKGKSQGSIQGVTPVEDLKAQFQQL